MELSAGLLSRRLALLPEKDRQMMELVLYANSSLRGIARLMRRPAGSVARRVSVLRRRLDHPVLAALVIEGDQLSPQLFQIAQARFAAGLSNARIAHHLVVTPGYVKTACEALEQWAKGLHAAYPHQQ